MRSLGMRNEELIELYRILADESYYNPQEEEEP